MTEDAMQGAPSYRAHAYVRTQDVRALACVLWK